MTCYRKCRRTLLGLVVLSLAACGPEPRGQASNGATAEYRAPISGRTVQFDAHANSVTSNAGGEVPTEDCSTADVVCLSYRGGPTIAAVSRRIQAAQTWQTDDRVFTITARSDGSMGALFFVEVASPDDPAWRESFTYEVGVGVTSMTTNYDAATGLSETLVLASRKGILARLID